MSLLTFESSNAQSPLQLGLPVALSWSPNEVEEYLDIEWTPDHETDPLPLTFIRAPDGQAWCQAPADCPGQGLGSHRCPGSWSCEDNMCVYSCGVVSPDFVEPPVCESGDAVTMITCVEQTAEAGGTKATIQFPVLNLGNPDSEIDLIWPEDEEASPIAVTPDDSLAATMIGGICDGSIGLDGNTLRVFTDEIGCSFGELVLYENQGYRYGWFKYENVCGGPDDVAEYYTEVECVVAPSCSAS